MVKKLLSKILLFMLIAVFSVPNVVYASPASTGSGATTTTGGGLSPDQQDVFNRNIPYFNTCGGSPNSSSSNSSGSTTTGTPSGGESFDLSTGGQTTIDTDGSNQKYWGTQYQQTGTNLNVTEGGKPAALDTEKINWYVLQTGWADAHGGIKLGDIAALTYNGKTVYAVFGDNNGTGSQEHSEISVAATTALQGKNDNIPGNLHYTIYPGSHKLLNITPDSTTGANSPDSMDQLQAKIDQVGAQLSGAGGVNGTSTNPSSSSDCCSTSSGSTTGNSEPVIVIDPGHSGSDISDTDPQTGLFDHDFPNVPEISEVFTVAQKVQKKLESDGYKVVMTKSSVNDSVSLRKRADIADQANADLALSIHDSHGTSWDDMGGGAGGQVYTQNVGDYRQNQPGMGRGTGKVSFTDSSVADTSNKYGQIFAQERTSAEHHKVIVTHDSFDGRAGIPGGNIPEVELYSKVPWVYNEVGAPGGALSSSEIDSYAQGIINGVEKAVPSSSSGNSQGSASCCDTSNQTSVAADTGGSAYKSGLQPPYIVEQFAIGVLQDLAQKKNQSTTDAVTKEHVLALVAWAFIEGGDIMNSSLFNLYNTGQSDPGFTAGGHTSNGLGSYVSFDAGVEETARTIDDGSHNGMLKVLLDPNSKATDFAHAESYSGTSSYPGTSEWAGAANSDPSGYEHGTWGPMLQQVKSDYKNYASVEIGTPALEQQDNKRDPSKLSNISSGGFSTGSNTSCSSGNTQGAAGILQEALKLAWPDPFGVKNEPGRSSPLTNKPDYQAVLDQIWKGSSPPYGGADCGSFVGAVMRGSGADPNYPLSYTPDQWKYVLSHPNLYDVQQNVSDMSSLQPGDILIVGGDTGGGAAGHTWIYVGKQPGGYWSASASGGGRSGNLTNDDLQPRNGTGYLRARLK